MVQTRSHILAGRDNTPEVNGTSRHKLKNIFVNDPETNHTFQVRRSIHRGQDRKFEGVRLRTIVRIGSNCLLEFQGRKKKKEKRK